ncbi:MAG: hypothetical protein M3443_08070, partial [Actinomycetota bacterium]|nr:hypothetical protein [Actinomycetota bacterium]
AERCRARDIPLVKLSPADVKAGKAGVCGHIDWTLGMKDGSHTDPGGNFPWDHVMTRVHVHAGIEEDGMASAEYDNLYAWLVKGGPDATKAVAHPDSLFGRTVNLQGRMSNVEGFLFKGGVDTADGPRPGISPDSVIGRLKALENAAPTIDYARLADEIVSRGGGVSIDYAALAKAVADETARRMEN